MSAYTDAVLEDAPTLYLRLNEASGLDFADSSGLNRPGVGFGDIVPGEDGAIADDSSSGSVYFPSDVDSYIDAGYYQPSYALLAMRPGSIEVWVKVESGFNSGGLMILGRASFFPGGFNAYELICGDIDAGGVYSTEPVRTGLSAILLKSGAGTFCNAQSMLPDDEWTHVVFTSESGVASLYRNGEFVTASAPLADAPGDVNNSFLLGKVFAGTAGFRGRLSELSVYDAVLSPERVLAHYEAGVAEPPPVFEYPRYHNVCDLTYADEASWEAHTDASGACRSLSDLLAHGFAFVAPQGFSPTVTTQPRDEAGEWTDISIDADNQRHFNPYGKNQSLKRVLQKIS